VLASALYLPPVAWFGVFAALAAVFAGTGGRSRAGDFALLGVIVALSAAAAYEPGWQDVRWTPYQKLAVRDLAADAGPIDVNTRAKLLRGERTGFHGSIGRTFIAVNNTGYQATVDLRPEAVAADPKRFPPEQRGYSQYDLPS